MFHVNPNKNTNFIISNTLPFLCFRVSGFQCFSAVKTLNKDNYETPTRMKRQNTDACKVF